MQLFFDSCFDFSAISGIQNQEQITGVKITPNPFVTTCTIDLKMANVKHPIISIFTIAGELISNVKYASTSNVITLGENLKAGVYIISIRDGKRIHTEKIIKLE